MFNIFLYTIHVLVIDLVHIADPTVKYTVRVSGSWVTKNKAVHFYIFTLLTRHNVTLG